MPLKDIRCCKGAESKQQNVVSEESLHCRGVIVDQRIGGSAMGALLVLIDRELMKLHTDMTSPKVVVSWSQDIRGTMDSASRLSVDSSSRGNIRDQSPDPGEPGSLAAGD